MGRSGNGTTEKRDIHVHILILAGGGGTRLWPLSRQDFPKQFLRFGDEESLLEKSISRFLHSPITETISVATNAQYEALVSHQLEKLNPQKKIQIIVEPDRKNTAPAIAFAVKYLQQNVGIDERAPLLVLPSDHLIESQEIFLEYLAQIESLVQKSIVLFGIQPTKPETGYGYIQIGDPFNGFTHRVKRFVEKPDLNRAQEYLLSGDYYWNSGIFAFSVGLLWQELQLHAPDIGKFSNQSLESCRQHYQEMPNISFDYAVLEKSQKILICPLPVKWSDIGCWDSVYDIMAKDENQNAKYGNVLEIDTKNSLIIGGKRLISTIGLENLLIIETDDVTFISKKGESQKVKELVHELIKIGRTEGSNHSIKQFPWGTIQLIEKSEDFQIEKIHIFPNQSYELVSEESGKIISLSNSVQIGDIAHSFLETLQVEKGNKITLSNPCSQSCCLLLLTRRGKKL